MYPYMYVCRDLIIYACTYAIIIIVDKCWYIVQLKWPLDWRSNEMVRYSSTLLKPPCAMSTSSRRQQPTLRRFDACCQSLMRQLIEHDGHLWRTWPLGWIVHKKWFQQLSSLEKWSPANQKCTLEQHHWTRISGHSMLSHTSLLN